MLKDDTVQTLYIQARTTSRLLNFTSTETEEFQSPQNSFRVLSY